MWVGRCFTTEQKEKALCTHHPLLGTRAREETDAWLRPKAASILHHRAKRK